MMFGHVETVEDRIEHLERLRAQQDKSKGFTAFIAWTFQAENTQLARPHRRRRTSISARKPSAGFIWITSPTSKAPGSRKARDRPGRLKYGANDLGSIMIEENVVSQAGATFRMDVADMHRLIRDLGYEPHQRDNWYRLVN